MDQKDSLEFGLEEILQEFSNHPEAYEEPPAPSVSTDTVRLDQISQAVKEQTAVSGDTIRFHRVSEKGSTIKLGDTAPFQRVSEKNAEKEPRPSATAEPFPEDWEPKYEEPIEEYPIPEPIIFRPKSRLKELRSKLVAGPERLYYSLVKQGLGRLQISMALCLVVFLLCGGFTLLYAWGLVSSQRIQLLVFVQFLGLLLSALLGCNRLMEGMGDLLRLRFTVNTLLVGTFAVCCVDAVMCLQQLRIPVSAAFSWQMFVAMWSAYDRRSTLMGEMDTLRRATNLESVTAVPDWHQGKMGFLTGRGEVEHYMDQYTVPSGPERVLDWYGLSVLLASFAVGIMGGVRHGFGVGVQVCTAALLMGMPATAYLAPHRPKAILEKRLHKLGTVLCGWQGMKAIDKQTLFPLDDTDVFPTGAVKLNGVKFYGDRDPDEVVAYAAALIRANGGTLDGLFHQLLESRSGYVYSVENLNCYGNGGIGGEIQEEAVLMGTLQFMRKMGVFMDKGTQIDRAVYCAIDGELCGVFAVTYGKSKSSAAGVRTLCSCKGVAPVMTCQDFMLTETFLQSRFNINPSRMLFPKREVRQELAKTEPTGQETVVALTTKEGLAPKAYAVTGAKTLKSAMKAGVAVHMLGGICGLLVVAALAWVNGADILTPANVLLYELLWMVPGLLITEGTRTI